MQQHLVIIDNYDSFTYNLVAYCRELGVKTTVFYNDEINCQELESISPDKILLSPGPGNTKDSGVTLDIIANFHQKTPMLGVCLGHQCIAEYFGGAVVHANQVMHGKTSMINHNGGYLFNQIPQVFKACRYHSLIVDHTKVPDNIEITAYVEPDAKTSPVEIMALAHKDYPVYGVQFHPEAVLSEYGHRLLANFLEL